MREQSPKKSAVIRVIIHMYAGPCWRWWVHPACRQVRSESQERRARVRAVKSGGRQERKLDTMGRHLMVERVEESELPREQEAGGREHPNLSSVPSIQGCFQLRHNLEAVVEKDPAPPDWFKISKAQLAHFFPREVHMGRNTETALD